MELKIKDASEYAALTEQLNQESTNLRQTLIAEFINKDIVAAIEKATRYSTVVNIPPGLYPKETLIEDLIKLLKPKGFRVFLTHDGGGMFDQVAISWGESHSIKKPVTYRKNI